MKIEVLVPDVTQDASNLQDAQPGDTSLFTQAYTTAAATLDRAQEAERSFAAGKGTLLAMTTARAGADVALSTATAIASRISQFASTLGNMSL